MEAFDLFLQIYGRIINRLPVTHIRCTDTLGRVPMQSLTVLLETPVASDRSSRLDPSLENH